MKFIYNPNAISHSGVVHDENPPGRGSGRYPWGSGAKNNKPKLEANRSSKKIKQYKNLEEFYSVNGLQKMKSSADTTLYKKTISCGSGLEVDLWVDDNAQSLDKDRPRFWDDPISKETNRLLNNLTSPDYLKKLNGQAVRAATNEFLNSATIPNRGSLTEAEARSIFAKSIQKKPIYLLYIPGADMASLSYDAGDMIPNHLITYSAMANNGKLTLLKSYLES